MRNFLILLVLFFVLSEKKVCEAKIYDCFLFYNEIEILQIRLDELYDYVDYFVLVEASETFRGRPKPFIFSENRHLFEKYLNKIIYVPVEERLNTDNPWDRERFQRNQIARGLINCSDEDIIMYSDVDEVVSHDGLPLLINALLESKAPFVFCDHKMFRYFLDRWDVPNTPWPGTEVTTFKFFKNTSADGIRGNREVRSFPHIEAGWHFTSMGGVERFITKIENWSHHEYDRKENKDPIKIRREASGSFLVKIDETYPRYIQKNYTELKERGFIDPIEDIPLNQVKTWWQNYESLNAQNTSYPHKIPEPFFSSKNLSYDTSGYFDKTALQFLEKFIKENNVKTIVDVGAWLGLSTQCLALMLPLDGLVYAIDFWTDDTMLKNDPRATVAYEYFLSNMKHAQISHKVIPFKMNSIDAADQLHIGADLVYIDTTTIPEKLYLDILAWYSKVAPKGIICGIHAEDPLIRNALENVSLELQGILKIEDSFWYLSFR